MFYDAIIRFCYDILSYLQGLFHLKSPSCVVGVDIITLSFCRCISHRHA